MATFTHTISWIANIEGIASSYTFTYTIDDVDDVERFTSGRQLNTSAVFRSEPVFVAVLNKVADGALNIQESAGPTAMPTAWNVSDGDLVVFHLSDSGGTWNSTASDATTTLRANDEVIASSLVSAQAGCDILALHQPAS